MMTSKGGWPSTTCSVPPRLSWANSTLPLACFTRTQESRSKWKLIWTSLPEAAAFAAGLSLAGLAVVETLADSRPPDGAREEVASYGAKAVFACGAGDAGVGADADAG